MTRLRRWAFRSLAAMSLLVLAAAIGAEVFALSANDLWSYQTVRWVNGGHGKLGEEWVMEFAGGGVQFEHWSETYVNLGIPPRHFAEEGQIHHEAFPAGPMNVRALPMIEPPYPFGSFIKSSLFETGFGRGDFGFSYWHETSFAGFEKGFVAAVPIWLIGVASAVVLVLWELRHILGRRLHSHPYGVCLKCGYDLRATPDRCPECGTIPQKKEIISN